MRNPHAVYFTNVRFFLILLVVLVNLLTALPGLPDAAQALVAGIFTFHLPVFVLVTGFFTKKFWETPDAAAGLLRIGLQYLFFQTVYSLLDLFWLKTPGMEHSFWLPYWMLWFLTAHLGWKLLLVPFRKLKHPIAAAVLLGVAAGCLPADAGAWMGITRMLVFFPFFLAGYYWREGGKAPQPAAVRRLLKAGAALLLLALPVLWQAAGAEAAAEWLAGGTAYADLGVPAYAGAAMRLAFYAAQAAASAAFLQLLPRTESRVTVLGGRTVYVFLLHGAAIKLLAAAGLLGLLTERLHAGGAVTAAAIFAAALAAAGIVAVLSSGKLAAAMRPVIEPDAGRLLRWMHLQPRERRARGTY
ncbi:acyltransferase family protein [Paenibacillus sp. FJAT-26967]|uniref:acyltransferase family protein n=1 Tax=Paenibacillus sp. FJAT-26967 TaxID=1729690 RepID=UPI0008381E05|nr:acyltransferase family protein [Paenibacillus sp. FJAT-26967]